MIDLPMIPSFLDLLIRSRHETRSILYYTLLPDMALSNQHDGPTRGCCLLGLRDEHRGGDLVSLSTFNPTSRPR